MKTITLAIAFFVGFILPSSGQINPISNLTWMQYYDMPYNYFQMNWDEPASPHDELIGYNVYREDELYRFQTENSLYNLENGSNCGEDFLMFRGGEEFYAHVTAVYNPGPVESDYTETVLVLGAAIKVEDFEYQKAIIYPNPSNGIMNIGNVDLNIIQIYNIAGKKIKELTPQSQIDLSDISKGIYFVKLISDKGILVNKIILE
ncbi:MAG: T9SS type A sorting domain-containing protein [Aequorivita sp.]